MYAQLKKEIKAKSLYKCLGIQTILRQYQIPDYDCRVRSVENFMVFQLIATIVLIIKPL